MTKPTFAKASAGKPSDRHIAMARAVVEQHGGVDISEILAAADPIPDLPTECEACGEGEFHDYPAQWNPRGRETARAFNCGHNVGRGLDPSQIINIHPCSRAHELLVKMKGEGRVAVQYVPQLA